MQRTRVSGYGQRSWPQGEAVVLPNRRQRRLISRLLAAPVRGLAACGDWHHWGYAGCAKRGQGRQGACPLRGAGGTQFLKLGEKIYGRIFKKTCSYPQGDPFLIFLVFYISCF